MKISIETTSRRGIITLNDLTFGTQYFHSASLQVRPQPNGQLDVVLIISVFVHNGMREIGTKGNDVRETVKLFGKVTALTGGKPLNQLEEQALSLEKYEELQYYQKALEEKAKEAAKEAAR